MDRDTLLELIPAYAVDALDADEREAVAAFIQRDPEAQAIFADYEAISAILPLAAPMRPAPAHLQNDLRQRLAARKTEAPKAAPQVLPKVEESTKPIQKPSRVTPIAVWLLSAAAVLALVIVGGFALFRSQPTMSPEMAAAKALYESIAAQTDAQRFEVLSEDQFTVEGELVVSADGSASVLRIASLPNVSSEESYQLWLASDNAIDSGGIFHWPTGHGPYYIEIKKPVDELVRIGMTIEPFEGSPEPEGTRIFGIQVASAR